MSGRSAISAAGPGTETIRAEIDRAILEFLAERERDVEESDAQLGALVAEIERVVRAGGKRLRPLFCYWGYRAAGGAPGPEIVGAAASLELVHTFAIVHDDVMDRSPVRRGEPATFRALAETLPPDVRGDPAGFGSSAAILVGDLASAFADEMFVGSGFPTPRLLAAWRLAQTMRAEVIGGQYLDLLAAARRHATPSEARRIGVLKSGGYTVEKPLLVGAALAGAPDALLGSLSRFGVPLGEAFQIRDDILGAFGDPSVTGKDADGDFREGKQTLLIALARDRLTGADRVFLEERLGTPDLSRDEIIRIRALLRECGALREAGLVIGELLSEARAALREAGLPPEPSAALGELADLVVAREL